MFKGAIYFLRAAESGVTSILTEPHSKSPISTLKIFKVKESVKFRTGSSQGASQGSSTTHQQQLAAANLPWDNSLQDKLLQCGITQCKITTLLSATVSPTLVVDNSIVILCRVICVKLFCSYLLMSTCPAESSELSHSELSQATASVGLAVSWPRCVIPFCLPVTHSNESG